MGQWTHVLFGGFGYSASLISAGMIEVSDASVD